MRYLALATDYDGTLASGGVVSDDGREALRALKSSGRKLLLVTGRRLEDLRQVFDGIELFDMIVAENGALIFSPATGDEVLLSEAPPAQFLSALQRRKVPVAPGKVIVGTDVPNDVAVLEVIRELGLELEIIYNKGSVMVLPGGVNKATGLASALGRFGLSAHNVVGVGDAENDHSFLRECEFSAAVRNALPVLKKNVDFVSRRAAGRGVADLVSRLLADDLAELSAQTRRHDLVLGQANGGRDVRLPPFGPRILLAGSSGGGKSRVAKSFLERLNDQAYQFFVIDPEGDYEDFEFGIVLGGPQSTPTIKEVIQVLEQPSQNVVVTLLGVPLADRPNYFASLLLAIQEMRSRTGRPHWLVVDEAHHVLPANSIPALVSLPDQLNSVLYVTAEPASIEHRVLKNLDGVLVVGDAPKNVISEIAEVMGRKAPPFPRKALGDSEVLLWRPGSRPTRFTMVPTSLEHHRHRRKYAEGDIGPDRSFYFRGPGGRLNIKAQNLNVFVQVAAGLDLETWHHHLDRGDYTRWFREMIKDDELADLASREEKRPRTGDSSRQNIIAAIQERYTPPA